MKLKWDAVLVTAGMMAFGYLATPALAGQSDKQITFRFSQPVEVPGRVLSPGTYVFKPADLAADRNVIQISSEDEHGIDHLVATIMAIPAYRLDIPEKPIMTFEERQSGAAEAVHSWFLPGDNDGWEFVYPKAQGGAVASNASPARTAAATAASAAPKPMAVVGPARPQNHALIALDRPLPNAEIRSKGKNANRPLSWREFSRTASNAPFAQVVGILMLVCGAVVLTLDLLCSSSLKKSWDRVPKLSR
jgi:hypothetical protein